MMIRTSLAPALLLTALFMGTGCASKPSSPRPAAQVAPHGLPEDQCQEIARLMGVHRAPSVGVGVIRGGRLVQAEYFGEQAPGVPLSRRSLFNTASVQKAVTAETVLRLVEDGRLSLDEVLSDHFIHPDLASDDRHRRLTPRIVLAHRTGLRNWGYEYDDGKLAFDRAPDAAYGYSGAGVMILARAIEVKLEKPWPSIVREEIFDPLHMEGASVAQERWMQDRVVIPAADTGGFEPGFELDYGEWSAADDLFVTVEDHAKFLIAVLEDHRAGGRWARERIKLRSDLTDNEIWRGDGMVDPYPAPFGHGLGWFIFGYGDRLNLQHGGNDATEAAIGYIDLHSGDGGIVFVNSVEGVQLWPKIVDVIDREQHFTAVFHHVIEKFL